MGRVVDHLATDARCEFLSRVRDGDAWKLIRQDAAEAKATIEKGKYFFIYALQSAITVRERQVSTVKKEDAFRKRSEVIRIGSKLHVSAYQLEGRTHVSYRSDPPNNARDTVLGLWFELAFSNEYVRGDRIVSKSDAFRASTARLLGMLQNEFVTWRGPHCFDNTDVNVGVFGDRFRKRAR